MLSFPVNQNPPFPSPEELQAKLSEFMKTNFGDKVSFKIIGDKNYYCNELGIQGEPWIAASEIEDLSKIDIGIMPFPDDEWAKGKCGLKGLQYMALEIPTLMSPVGVNSEIIQEGVNGYLPNTEDEWVAALTALIEDATLRERIGKEGRKTVVDRYSVHAWKQSAISTRCLPTPGIPSRGERRLD